MSIIIDLVVIVLLLVMCNENLQKGFWMGVLVAIFAMISINYQAFTNAKISMAYVLVMNLSMTLCIVVMLGLILIFVNKAKNKKFLWLYICILAVLAIATIGVCIAMI